MPAGASGSSMIKLMLFVPAGGSPQLNAGETSGPSQVNFFGMSAPAVNAELFKSKAMALPPSGVKVTLAAPSTPARSRQGMGNDRAHHLEAERVAECFICWHGPVAYAYLRGKFRPARSKSDSTCGACRARKDAL